MESLSHLAGIAITLHGEFVIQRCSICGGVLIDSRGQAAPLNPDGSTPKTSTWQTGRFVRVTLGNPTESLLLDDTDKLPDDSCVDTI